VNVVYFFIEQKGPDGTWASVSEAGDAGKGQQPRLWQCERLEEARKKAAELKGAGGTGACRILRRTKKDGNWVNETVEEL
jgi:hypothetical protein